MSNSLTGKNFSLAIQSKSMEHFIGQQTTGLESPKEVRVATVDSIYSVFT